MGGAYWISEAARIARSILEAFETADDRDEKDRLALSLARSVLDREKIIKSSFGTMKIAAFALILSALALSWVAFDSMPRAYVGMRINAEEAFDRWAVWRPSQVLNVTNIPIGENISGYGPICA